MFAPCRWIVTAVVTSVFAGCVGAQFETTPLNPDPAPAGMRPASAVEVFSSGPSTRAHVDVRMIEVYNSSDPIQTLAELRAEAGREGCDAIFVPNITGGHAKATCMRYTAP
jgi:hypothetical protein